MKRVPGSPFLLILGGVSHPPFHAQSKTPQPTSTRDILLSQEDTTLAVAIPFCGRCTRVVRVKTQIFGNLQLKLFLENLKSFSSSLSFSPGSDFSVFGAQTLRSPFFSIPLSFLLGLRWSVYLHEWVPVTLEKAAGTCRKLNSSSTKDNSHTAHTHLPTTRPPPKIPPIFLTK